jgi:putative SOS response-associated peptidase YedK
MCCRYLLDREHLAEVLTRLGLRLPDESLFGTRYNIPPGGPIQTVRIRPHRSPGTPPEREAVSLHWGLIPAWARERKAFGASLANARAETVPDKPVFRSAWKRAQRCLIPATGFYEWEKAGKARLPWVFRRADGRPFCFAGLWESWHDPVDHSEVGSCTLLTTVPNALLARIHDRMPVMLDDADAEAWLDPDQSDPRPLLRPFPADALTATALIPRVNSVAHDDPECLTAAAPAAPGTSAEQLGLGF